MTDDNPDNSKTPPQAGRPESLKYLRIMLLRVLATNLQQEINELDRQSALDDKPSLDFNAEVRRFEIELIRSALIQTRGRQRRAAVLLGLNSATFNRKVRQYGIELDLLEQSE